MSTPTSGPSSTPTSAPAPTSTSTPSFFGSILSAPGAVASGGVGWLLAAAGFGPRETAVIASNPAVAEAAVTAAGSSSGQTPADQFQAVVGSPVVQTVVATVAAETNSSSSSAPLTGIAAIKAQLAKASMGKNTSAASKERLAEYNELTKQPHKVYEAGGGGGSKANAKASTSRYSAPKMGHAFDVALAAAPSLEKEHKALRKELDDAVGDFLSGKVKDKSVVDKLEKLVFEKQEEIRASKKSSTRKSRQRRARRQTRRSQH